MDQHPEGVGLLSRDIDVVQRTQRLPRQPRRREFAPLEHKDDATLISEQAHQTGSRLVHITIHVQKLSDINDVTQTFSCRYQLRATFKETWGMLRINPEQSTWSAESFPFDPQLGFLNLLTENAERENWWRVTHDNFDDLIRPEQSLDPLKVVWVHQFMRGFGVFEECLELRRFPLDIQHLHITITSRWSFDTVVLRFCEVQPSAVAESATHSQLFRLHRPRLIAFDHDWHADSDLPLLSLQSESRTGARYCRCHFAITVDRRAMYYVWNIVSMQLLISFANLSTFAIDAADLASRLSLLITLILASAAFKFVMMQMLPATPYVTLLDELIYLCLFQQAGILLTICLMPGLSKCFQLSDFELAELTIATSCVLLLVYGLRVVYFMYRRSQKLQAINVKFDRYFKDAVQS